MWSDTETHLEKNREDLRAAVHPEEQKYLLRFHRPKEVQYVRFYTHKLNSLGSSSSQRGESYHNVVKRAFHRQLPLDEAVRLIGEDISELADVDNDLVMHSADRGFASLF